MRTVPSLAIALFIAAAPATADEAAGTLWLETLETETPQAGFELAITLSRRAVKTTQPNVEVLRAARPTYAKNADSLIGVSRTVAIWFATIAEANDHWRRRE